MPLELLLASGVYTLTSSGCVAKTIRPRPSVKPIMIASFSTGRARKRYTCCYRELLRSSIRAVAKCPFGKVISSYLSQVTTDIQSIYLRTLCGKLALKPRLWRGSENDLDVNQTVAPPDHPYLLRGKCLLLMTLSSIFFILYKRYVEGSSVANWPSIE